MTSCSLSLTPFANHAAFNGDDHGDDSEREYDRLRDLARAEAEKRNACYDKVRPALSVFGAQCPPYLTLD